MPWRPCHPSVHDRTTWGHCLVDSNETHPNIVPGREPRPGWANPGFFEGWKVRVVELAGRTSMIFGAAELIGIKIK